MFIALLSLVLLAFNIQPSADFLVELALLPSRPQSTDARQDFAYNRRMESLRHSSSLLYRLILMIGFGTLTWAQWFFALIMGIMCFPALPWVAYESASRDIERRRAYRSSVTQLADDKADDKATIDALKPKSLWLGGRLDQQGSPVIHHWILSSLAAIVIPVVILQIATLVLFTVMTTLNIPYDLWEQRAVIITTYVLICGSFIAIVIWRIQAWLNTKLIVEPHSVVTAQSISEKREIGRRVVEAFEIERERIERDLHDGAQQFLVASNMKIGEALMLHEFGAHDDVAEVLAQAQHANDEALSALRRTVAGVHPQVLTDRGLGEAVAEVVSESPVNARLMIPHPLPSMPAGVSAAAYFLVCEALTNIAKYAPEADATVTLVAGADLVVSIVDNGPGGAVIYPGHGLSGLAARLQAFGGDLSVSSPVGGPTEIRGYLPLLLMPGESGIVINDDRQQENALDNDNQQADAVDGDSRQEDGATDDSNNRRRRQPQSADKSVQHMPSDTVKLVHAHAEKPSSEENSPPVSDVASSPIDTIFTDSDFDNSHDATVNTEAVTTVLHTSPEIQTELLETDDATVKLTKENEEA